MMVAYKHRTVGRTKVRKHESGPPGFNRGMKNTQMRDPKRIRAVIVDDELPARNRLRELLKSDPAVEVIDECANGREAVKSIASKALDLVFLDIHMPEIDGFGVIKALAPNRLPAIIFVTADDQCAVQAFEVNAIDYLLKPFDRRRFEMALDRAKEHLLVNDHDGLDQQLNSLLHQLKDPHKQHRRFVVKSGGRVFFLKNEEIDWIEAAGNYVRLHVGTDIHLLRETMSAIQMKLDPSLFIRIHRSTFVNIEKIKELQPWFHGEYVVILRDGTQLTMSRSHRNNLPELLGNAL